MNEACQELVAISRNHTRKGSISSDMNRCLKAELEVKNGFRWWAVWYSELNYHIYFSVWGAYHELASARSVLLFSSKIVWFTPYVFLLPPAQPSNSIVVLTCIGYE